MKSPLILIGVPVFAVLVASAIQFATRRNARAFVQLLGAAFLAVMVLAHVAETFHLFPGMGWGLRNSVGHYIDLTSAVAGLILLPSGYLLERVCNR
jgi:hypothetical protein